MDILKYSKYEDLPDRIILQREPLNKTPIYSYGTIVKCGDYFLLVQRRISIQFQIIVKGSYRKSELYSLCLGLSLDEKNILLQSCDSKNFENLYNLMMGIDLNKKYSFYKKDKTFEFSQNIFFTNVVFLKKILLSSSCAIETEYYWPKGRSNNMESYYSTAIRETYEETGLDVSSFRKIDYLEDKYVGINNCIYINCLWHIDLQEKDWWRKGSGPKEEKTTIPYVTNKNSEIEISNTKWIHKDLLINYLSREKYLLIKKYL